MPTLEEYLALPLTPVPDEILERLEAGPIDPADAQRVEDVDRLLDPAPLAEEFGYCWMPDGVGYAAMRNQMPAGPREMAEWWFEWHPQEDIRYQIWHPKAHISSRVDPSDHRLERPYWDVTLHPVEDIGLGVEHMRMDFKRPEQLGFSPGALDRPGVAGIMGGFVGDDKKRAFHTLMIHVFLDDPETGGYVLRSRFWIGSMLRPYGPAPIAGAIGALVNHKAFRRVVVPRSAPQVVALHSAEEFEHLATILPALYAEYGPGANVTE
jgi:phloretin hydrolase